MCGCIYSWSIYFYQYPVSCGISGTGCRDKPPPTPLLHFLMREKAANTHPEAPPSQGKAVGAGSRCPCHARVGGAGSQSHHPLTGTPGAQLPPSCWGLMLEPPSRRSTVPILGSAGSVLPAWSGAGGHRESTQAAAHGLQKASISCHSNTTRALLKHQLSSRDVDEVADGCGEERELILVALRWLHLFGIPAEVIHAAWQRGAQCQLDGGCTRTSPIWPGDIPVSPAWPSLEPSVLGEGSQDPA